MADDFVSYDKLIDAALRTVVRETLRYIAEHGLPGQHHIYLSFQTDFPKVEIADYLHQEYPDEMTIVLQHQFWGLEAGDDAFEVTLGFNDIQERLTVPYAALTAFVDPSVKFGLQFQRAEGGKTEDEPRPSSLWAPAGGGNTGPGSGPASARNDRSKALGEPAAHPEAGREEEEERETEEDAGEEKIISLDAFRKK